MKIAEIKDFPTTLDTGKNGHRVHESVLRSYQTLEKAKELLKKGTPCDVILEIIEEIESAPSLDKEIEHKDIQSV